MGEDAPGRVALRPYDPDASRDRTGLWACKRAFELELGGGTGAGGDGTHAADADGTPTDDRKARAYRRKLTAAYRDRYREWVRRCVADDPRTVTVADPGPGVAVDHHPGPAADPDGDGDAADTATETARSGTDSGSGADSTSGAGAGPPVGAPTPDGGLAGYVFVLPARLAMVWDAAVLDEVYVAPAYRGTGLADRLLDRAVSVARDQEPPLSRIVLDVDRGNARARSLYERHGFERWGEMLARRL